MELRYEVSPSEAGIVIDGLHARHVEATLLTRRLGDDVDTVSIQVATDEEAEAARVLVDDLTSLATPVATE